jgi:hypothetical protein
VTLTLLKYIKNPRSIKAPNAMIGMMAIASVKTKPKVFRRGETEVRM